MEAANQPQVEPVHTVVRGRARFRVPDLYRAPGLVEWIIERIGEGADVRSVSASAVTGNVLILFDPGLDWRDVGDRLGEAVAAAGPEAKQRRDGASLDGFRFRGRPLLELAGGLRFGERGRASKPVAAHEVPVERAFHILDALHCVALVESRADNGLTADEAELRLTRFGPNVLGETPPRTVTAIFFAQFNSLPVWLLLGSSALSAATGGVADALVILGVVALNALVGAATEAHAESSIAALTRVQEPRATVIRDGRAIRISGEAIVPGDLIELARASYIPADARLLQASDLAVDESALTGESVPAAKQVEPLVEERLALGDRLNMVYRGTVVTGGGGLAVVTATGGSTEIGRIQRLMATAQAPETPLQRQLRELGNQLVGVSGAMCAAVFAVGLMRGYGALTMLRSAISLAVAAIPEGLPTVATATLALGLRNLRAEGMLVRRLHAVETLGSLRVVCLDKTGTITRNRMMAVAALVGLRRLDIGEAGIREDEAAVDPAGEPDLQRLAEIAALCSDVAIGGEGADLELSGSPTETALLEMALTIGVDAVELRRRLPRSRVVQRTQTRNYMTTEHQDGDGFFLALKGAPAEVAALCSSRLERGEIVDMDEEFREALTRANDRMAGEALRVLGLAFARTRGAEEAPALTWVGMAGLADPAREGLEQVIAKLHRAGVRTVMLTGDQSATAYAIGKQLDLGGGETMEIIDSMKLESIEPALLGGLAKRVHIFSRVNPAHKLTIVRAMQSSGEVVAMTGDGVNDGPALKAADVGVAMGKGAEVARETADVILAGDDVSTLIAAIAQGRTRHDDIRKAIHFIVSSNLSEVLMTFLSLAAGFGEPLNPRQLLWINLLTDVFPELALAVEPPEDDVLASAPRPADAPLFDRKEALHIATEGAVTTAWATACFRLGLARYGPGRQASAMAFLSLTGAQLLHTITSRSERHSIFDRRPLPRNDYIPAAIGVGLLAEALAAFVPGVRKLLGGAKLSGGDLTAVSAAAVASFLSNETLKHFRNHRGLITPRPPDEAAEAPAGEDKP